MTAIRKGPRKRSYLTVTDQFCGAGGSSLGAVASGLEVQIALNHWKLAIETHATNFPQVEHDCADISACDPRRYRSTDMLITSPECTTHSPAGGSHWKRKQEDLFTPADPALVRSRATAWDVVRFAEYHQYRSIIVENVLEFTRWPLFPEWLRAMDKLGYAHQIVSLNSMFAHPTPQSRDRVYTVFWRQGDRAPDLTHRHQAWCPKCETQVESVQSWRTHARIGRYRQQYRYCCPACATIVTPYYFAALNAIDLSIPGERIGDKKRPLKPRTLERIRYGLEKFGRRALMVRTNMTTNGGRVRPADSAPLHTQTASWLDAVVGPTAFLVETTFSHSADRRPVGLDEAMMTQSTRQSAALVQLPFMVNGHMSRRVYGAEEPLSTQAASREHDAVVIPPAAMVANRRNNVPRSLADPLPVFCTGGHHMLVAPSALLTMRHAEAMLLRGLDRELATQVAAGIQDWVISPVPMLASYYGTQNVSPADEGMPTLTTVDRHALVEPSETSVEDCYFRMLQPHEIGAGMAFPANYKVLGNKRDQVRQYGNAVTPPAMAWLVRQCIAALVGQAA